MDSSAVQVSQVATWSSLAMKEGKHLIAQRTRVEDMNKMAEPAERGSEIKCGAFFLQDMANSTGAPAQKCGAIQKQKRLSGWKEEDLTIAFLELRRCEIVGLSQTQCIDDKGNTKKIQQQAGGGGCEYAPAALSGGSNDV